MRSSTAFKKAFPKMEGSYLIIRFKAFPVFSVIVIRTVAVLERTALFRYLLEDVNFQYITASPLGLRDILYF